MTTKEKFVRDRLLCAARFAAIFAAAASASTCALASDTVLHSFTGSDGANPYAGLASDGSNLYGVTFSGGSSGQGVVFELPLSGGTLTTLCTFAGSGSGAGPTGTPVLDSSNNVYGTAAYASLSGGLGSGNGIVFKCPSGGGVLSSLHTFGGGTTDGANPFAGLVTDGSNLYGTTFSGGSSSKGIAFKLPLSGGTLTILHSFTGGSADGASPYSSVALNSTNLFGTTTLGGSTSNEGVVFELPSSGGSSPTYPHRFILGNGDGTAPRGNVILDSSGNIFGTTSIGGSSGKGVVFELTPTGTGTYNYTNLHVFTGTSPDGANPWSNLVLDSSSGNLYGTTTSGGSPGQGVIFKLTPTGTGSYTYSTLYSFAGGVSDGANPYAGLILISGTLYGTTVNGGASGKGTVSSYVP